MHKSNRLPGLIANASVLAMALAAACSEQRNASGSGVTERDSAGVAIVEHTNDHINALPRWTFDSTPSVQIDGTDPANLFVTVRVAVERANGRIVVAEARSGELREYSPIGKFERLLARRGKGPGEIGNVSTMHVTPEDSLVVFDGNLRRVTIFDPDGKFARQVLYPRFPDGSFFTISRMLSDKRLIGSLRKPTGRLTETQGPITRDTFALVRVSTNPSNARDSAGLDSVTTSQVDTIALAPDVESYPTAFPEGGKVYPERDFLILGRRTNIAANDRLLYVGTNTSDEIAVYVEGKLTRKIRGNATPGPVTAEQKDSVRQEIRDLYKNPQMAAREGAAETLDYLLTQRRIADVHAFYESLSLGVDGTLWVEEPRLHEQDGRKYIVYDEDGRPIARAEFPGRTAPVQFSRSRILGVQLSDDDVPHVMIWKLVTRQTDKP